MKVLTFDTETTGLPRNWGAPITDSRNWPRLVQIAWVETDMKAWKAATHSSIVLPHGFTIPKEASDIHRITTERALDEGIPLEDVLDGFAASVSSADLIVAHNYSFDRAIMGAEFYRKQYGDLMKGKMFFCTMRGTIKYVGAKNRNGRMKLPSNMELYKKLFNEEFEDAHDAKADVEATNRSFWECFRLGLTYGKIQRTK
jgi:DNA polymerase-3 subunit epsilon